MNELHQRLVLRGAFVAMALLLGLPLAYSGADELGARLEDGAALSGLLAPLAGLLFGLGCCALAAIVAARIWQRIVLEREGVHAVGTVTGSTQADDLTSLVAYAFHDQQGNRREGTFRWPNDAWRAGDQGDVHYHAAAPGRSMWLDTVALREPTPPKAGAGNPRKLFRAHAGLVAALSAATGAAAVYMVWAPIWHREGLVGTFAVIEPWKVLLAWGLTSLVAAAFWFFVVGICGLFALVAFALIRHTLRD